MHSGKELPKVDKDALISTALMEMTAKGFGMTTVMDGQELLGVFTDGDLRRSLDQGIDFNTCHHARRYDSQAIDHQSKSLSRRGARLDG